MYGELGTRETEVAQGTEQGDNNAHCQPIQCLPPSCAQSAKLQELQLRRFSMAVQVAEAFIGLVEGDVSKGLHALVMLWLLAVLPLCFADSESGIEIEERQKLSSLTLL